MRNGDGDFHWFRSGRAGAPLITVMRALGSALMIVSALYWPHDWMPLLFAVGLITLIHAVERNIAAKIRRIRQHQQDSAIDAAIKAGPPGLRPGNRPTTVITGVA